MFSKMTAFLAALFLLPVVDSLWLFTAGRKSMVMLSKIQGAPVEFRFWAAAVVYVALAYLVLLAKSVWEAAAIGSATYAVYDFTNLATLKGYDWRMAVADTVWGGVLFGVVWSTVKLIGARS